jgi:hypothetical protein
MLRNVFCIFFLSLILLGTAFAQYHPDPIEGLPRGSVCFSIDGKYCNSLQCQGINGFDCCCASAGRFSAGFFDRKSLNKYLVSRQQKEIVKTAPVSLNKEITCKRITAEEVECANVRYHSHTNNICNLSTAGEHLRLSEKVEKIIEKVK